MDRFGQSRRRLRVCAVFESIKISKDRVGLTARYEIGGAGLAERGDRLMPEPEHRLAGAAARLGRAREDRGDHAQLSLDFGRRGIAAKRATVDAREVGEFANGRVEGGSEAVRINLGCARGSDLDKNGIE